MKWTLAFVALAAVTLSADPGYAFPKASNGVACNSTGTARKDGKDQDGKKVNCQWDTCTYCGTTSGVIDCRIQLTEYSNPTDCHAAAQIFGGNANQSLMNGNLGFQQSQPTNPNPKPKKFGNGAIKLHP